MLYSVLAFIIASSVIYAISQPLFVFLAAPLMNAMQGQGNPLIFTSLTEVFFSYLKISMLGGFLLALPVLLYQLYQFLAPGLYKNEKGVMLPYLFLGPALFLGGMAFAYYAIFPLAWQFFLSFQIPAGSEGVAVTLMPKVNEYLGLVLHIMFAFGLAFQMPLILMLLVQFGALTTEKLKHGRRYAVVSIFVLAAVITPPDIISQVGLAIPLLLLYELTIVWSRTIKHKEDSSDVRHQENTV